MGHDGHSKHQNLFRYVSVDEFQDTSFAQYQLVRHLVWRHRNLCCVGSPSQAIYSWRGADIHNILERFREDFRDAPIVVLPQNYRSTATILSAAQAVVRDLPYREDLRTDNAQGSSLIVVPLNTDYDEANFIANEIKRLDEERFCGLDDCAVLFRTRAQGRLLEQVFMHLGLPYILVGDFKFFERREVKDILAYLRVVYDMFDAGALQRIINRPSRGLGPAALQKLQGGEPELNFAALTGLHRRTDLPPKILDAATEFADLIFDDWPRAAKGKSLPDFFDYVLERTGYLAWIEKDPDAKRRAANLRLLRALTTRYEHDADALGTFLADIATLSVVEGGDLDVPRDGRGVTLATPRSRSISSNAVRRRWTGWLSRAPLGLSKRPMPPQDNRQHIESVRANHPIEQVIARYIELRPSGRRFVGRCPFHDDTTPSLVVYTHNQGFYCFGCDVGGDVFKFVQLIEKVSFAEALQRLGYISRMESRRSERSGFNWTARRILSATHRDPRNP